MATNISKNIIEDKKHFVYITTNLLNNKKYIGDHSTNNLNDKYLGSGVYLKKSVKKYGRQNFSRKILEFAKTKEIAFNLQKKYIDKFNTLIPFGYNISNIGGYGIAGSSLSDETKEKIRISKMGAKNPMYGKKLSDERKKQISILHKGSKRTDKTRKLMSKASLGIPKSSEHKEKCRIANKGKIQSDETRLKRSQSMLGKNRYIKSEEHKRKISNSKKGSILSEDHKLKLSIASKKAWEYKRKTL